MQKHILSLIVILLMPLMLIAQSYTKMWKEVEQALHQDLPKTALQAIDRIITQAQRRDDAAQLIKAYVTRLAVAEDLSLDSAKATVSQIEALSKAATCEADKCAWQMVVGWVKAKHSRYNGPDSKDEAIAAYRAATENPAILAATPSKEYIPILIKGQDSRYYGHDMLSVIFPFVAKSLHNMSTPEADSLCRQVMGREIAWYRSHNNRQATLLATIDSARITGHDNMAFYQSILKQYDDLPLVTEAVLWLSNWYGSDKAYPLILTTLARHPNTTQTNALKNRLATLTRPTISCFLNTASIYPGKATPIVFSHRNVSRATLSYTRLPYAASDTLLQILLRKSYDDLCRTPDFLTEIPLRQGQPYELLKDTIEFQFPQPGIYLFKLSSPDTDPSYAIYHVSSLAVIQQSLPEHKTRVSVVDRLNGKPLPYAHVKTKTVRNKSTIWEDHDTDANGELILPTTERTNCVLYASLPGDNAMDEIGLLHGYEPHYYTHREQAARIYTDRAIYRPGQTVKVGGFLYTKVDDSTAVVAHTPTTLELRNANGRLIEKATATTDSLGAFGTNFTLPQEGMNGRFTIRNEYGQATFMVEEYKRPKFYVTINEPTSAYTLGDTLTLSGEAKTYTGLPLANAKVFCSSVRERSWWFRSAETEAPVTVRDTLTTDADGRFSLRVVLSSPSVDKYDHYSRFYTYTVTAKATADDGETEEATTYLYAGTMKAWVNTDLTDVVCKEHMPDFTASQTNCMGQAVAGSGLCILTAKKDTILTDSVRFNESHQFNFLRSLPSGQYTITIFPSGDNNSYNCYKHTFNLISLSDTKTTGTDPLQLWQSSKTFSYGDTVSVMVGTPLKDAWLRYDLMSNNSLIDSRIIHLSDTIVRFDYTYRNEYDKGISAQFSIYHKGTLTQRNAVITKPLPDKSLQIKWATFRDKLQPGAVEKWTMRITKDGQPVSASLLATMYDASLEKFTKHSLPFNLTYNRNITTRQWSAPYFNGLNLNATRRLSLLEEKDLSFTEPALTALGNRRYYKLGIKTKAIASGAMLYRNTVEESMPAMAPTAIRDDATLQSEAEPDITATVPLRTDFSETAFFASSLKTDATGEARIEFQLPESLTSWNFMALAHTADLNYGFIKEVIKVEKPLMVQANMPRFLRAGDRSALAVTIINHSDTIQAGKAQLSLTDPQSGKQLSLQTQPFSLKAGEHTAINFSVDATADLPLLICKYVAVTNDFSDGEQQYIPILSDVQETISTVPFTLTDTEAHTFSLSNLDYHSDASKSTLTVEYTGNPAWTAITALPSMLDYRSRCATQLAINYCATATMRQILSTNPQIRTAVEQWKEHPQEKSPLLSLENNTELKLFILNETPWANNADREQMQLEALAQDDKTLEIRQGLMLNKLSEMQTAEGGWYWFPGMNASSALTLDIAEMLVRTRHLCPATSAQTDLMISRALAFLDRKAANEVKFLKQNKSKTISTECMRYLYVAAMTKRELTPTRRYLLNRLAESATDYDLHSKALAACVLQAVGKQKEALATMRSLMEYTVSTPEMGRYFDGKRAPSLWSMYRIPTQVAAIEALASVTPTDKTPLAEMKLWLLQSKHTQEWNNPLAASRAIGCLLSTGMLDAPTALPAQMRLTTAKRRDINLNDRATINPFIQMGYQKATIPTDELGSAPQSILVQQSAATIEQPLSYGAVYLKNYLPASKIKALGSDMKLSAQFFHDVAGKWVALNAETALHKGDRLMVRYTIEATRDMDFVALSDGRAACMEPVDAASGYKYGYYRSLEDNGTKWYFDHLSKGAHIIEEQYDIDRTGTFQTACPQVQCQYAPEFMARATNTTLIVK